MAVPEPLQEWFVPSEPSGGWWTVLEGSIRCPCGCDRLYFRYPGGTHLSPQTVDGEPIPCTVTLHNRFGETWYYFAIDTLCPQCGLACEIFNNQLLGWGRVVADRDAEPMYGPKRMWPWRCLTCGSATHTGIVTFTRDPEAEFRERVGDRVPAEEWANAYTWFSMAIRCCGCGRESEPWVSYECR